MGCEPREEGIIGMISAPVECCLSLVNFYNLASSLYISIRLHCHELIFKNIFLPDNGYYRFTDNSREFTL